MTRGERGYSLVFAVAVLAAFSLLAAAMLSLSQTVSLQVRAANEITRGRGAADAAVEYGADRIVEDGAAATFASSAAFPVPGTIDGDTANVTVRNVSITSITICLPGEAPPCPSSAAPRTFGAVRDQQHDFRASAVSGGAPVAFAPVWSVSPATGATISQSGRFVATAAGTYAVRIEVDNVSAFVTVTVP